jgi:hypothetical protein
MADLFALGSDEGLFPTVKLICLSSYQDANGNQFTDLTLDKQDYEILKEHFRQVLAEEAKP